MFDSKIQKAPKDLSAVDENILIGVADNIRRKKSENNVEISKSQDDLNIFKEKLLERAVLDFSRNLFVKRAPKKCESVEIQVILNLSILN